MSLSKELGRFDSKVPEYRDAEIRPRISLTADVLDFRNCPRKYGFYKVRGFSTASSTSEFVGTFAHRSLEHAWRSYRNSGQPPANHEMAAILESTRAQMVGDENRKPQSWQAALLTGFQVMRLNRTMGDLGIFDRVVDCERVLRLTAKDFVIEGVIDLIWADGRRTVLWDYKASKDPRRTVFSPSASRRDVAAAKKRLEDYALQLLLYKHLYSHVFGEHEVECRLVFLGEILVEERVSRVSGSQVAEYWNRFPASPISRSEWNRAEADAENHDTPGLLYSVAATEESVSRAVVDFDSTAKAILEARGRDEWLAPPPNRLPEEQTCRDCDFLRSCPTASSRTPT